MDGDLLNQKSIKDFEKLLTAEGLYFIKKWNKTIGIILTIFALIWTYFSASLCYGFLSDFNSKGSTDELFSTIFSIIFLFVPTLFVIIGIIVLILGVSNLFNRTEIIINKNEIQVKNGPVPILRNRSVRSSDISQIYVKDATNNNNPSNSYNIHYINTKSETHFLTGNFFGISFPTFKLEEALEIEKSIEKYLSIRNKHVSGAINKLPEISENHFTDSTTEEISENRNPVKNEPETLLPNPSSLSVVENTYRLGIQKKWFSPMVIFYAFFTIFWNGTLGLILYLLIGSLIQSGNSELNLFLLFLIPFVFAGFYLLISTLAFIFNTTTLEMTSTHFSIKDQPIRYLNNYKIGKSNIELFDITIKTRRNRNGYSTYSVLTAHLKNGSKKEICNNGIMAFSEEEVQYLREKLNRNLLK